MLAQAQIALSTGVQASSLQLAAGQSLIPKDEPDPYVTTGALETTLSVATRTEISIAHPLALTTRAVPNGATYGQNVLNIIGGVATVSNAATAQEVLANGNRRYNPPAGQPPLKNLVAPLGFVGHGASAP